MKRIISLAVLASVLFPQVSFAQEKAQEKKPSIEVHGFVRSFFAYDSRVCTAGTEDFFTWAPKDRSVTGSTGDDINSESTFRFAALTSRLWVEVKGYEYNGIKFGARIESDFYSGLSGSTGTAQLRLRQAFVTAQWNENNSMKIGQAWHPMAADMPHIFSLNTGTPFGPFSRTPQVNWEHRLDDNFTVNAAAIWQMQYVSAGPEGASANYIKYGKTPELYVGLSYKKDGFLGRVGLDVLSIKPRYYTTRWVDVTVNGTTTSESTSVKVDDRITTFSPFVYLQYQKKDFAVKAKSIFAQAGEHMNLLGGYGIKDYDAATGEYEYTPTQTSSSWVSFSKGTQTKYILFLGYYKNFGTKDALYAGVTNVTPAGLYFQKSGSATMNQMVRATPTIIRSFGKFDLGLEYELTGVQYGDSSECNLEKGLYETNLHWVFNNRIQGLVKFTF
ncbi:MAG: hypothetical protein K5984_06050 [Bacteroidales bacterium]|nr:hypothetical protein [Bacteroidales bacterium]